MNWASGIAFFVGLSVGGLIAQGLAVKRLDQIRGLVLSNTAAKIATKEIWQARVDKVMAGGMAGVADDVLSRWFAPKVRMGALGQAVRARFLNAPVTGYAGVAAAVGGADFLTPTSGLRLPTLVIAGSDDGATPPDLVRELADLIPGADYHLIRGAGHLPPVDRAAEFAAKLTGFLHGVGHV